MKKENRIRKNEEFASIIEKRHSKASSSFVIYYNQRKEDHARVGISVSKRLGNAVVRNKIKRQVRMMTQELLDFSLASQDLIIIVRNAYITKTYADNKKDLEKAIKNCKII